MSGIVGIWNLNGKPVEREVLARMSATLAHRGPDGEEKWIEGPVGLACQLLRVTPESEKETQPLVGRSGAVVVFDGRLDNREELLASLKDSYPVSSCSPDPDLVLAAYEAFGDRFPERLVGDFALGLFDPSLQQLLLVRDAIGIRPLYYFHIGDTFVFASEIKALLAHPEVSPRPNDDVLALYLLARHKETRGMTFFEGVWSLLPAHTAICNPQRFVTRRYWDFDASQRIRLGSFGEYAEAFRDHFERGIRRRLRSRYPIVVSLSGGLDSSSIFCLAETVARENGDLIPHVLGVSYISPPGSPSDELAFLTEIERKYGVPITRLPVAPGGPLKGSREAVWYVESPLLDNMWTTTRSFLSTVHQFGARVVLTGHWADQILFDQAYLIDLFYRLEWSEIAAHLREFGRWFTDADARYFRRRLFFDLAKYSLPRRLVSRIRSVWLKPDRPWYTARLRSRARRHASMALPSAATFPTAHSRSLYEQARSHHQVMCMEWNNKVAAMHGVEMTFPFLDRELLSFLMRIPGEVQTWHGVPKVLLREGLRGVLPESIAGRTWKADFTYLTNEGVEEDYPDLMQSLEDDAMAIKLGYLRKDVMRVELDRQKGRLRGPNCDTAWRLSDLAGLEACLQVFFGENGNGKHNPVSIKSGRTAKARGGTQ